MPRDAAVGAALQEWGKRHGFDGWVSERDPILHVGGHYLWCGRRGETTLTVALSGVICDGHLERDLVQELEASGVTQLAQGGRWRVTITCAVQGGVQAIVTQPDATKHRGPRWELR
jgi:hypothetical protein